MSQWEVFGWVCVILLFTAVGAASQLPWSHVFQILNIAFFAGISIICGMMVALFMGVMIWLYIGDSVMHVVSVYNLYAAAIMAVYYRHERQPF